MDPTLRPGPPRDEPPGAGAAPADRLGALSGRLRLLVHHLTGRAIRAHVDLDDVVQEVLLRVLATDAAQWRDLDEPRLWRYVAQAARHTVVDLARAVRAARRRGPGRAPSHADWSRTGAAEPAATTRGPATRAAAAETAGELERAFAALSPEHRRVLGLRQFEGLSAEATAARMGRSAAAVHSLYRRALDAWAAAVPRPHRPGPR